jgi:endonuclease/exonuclease/phosphatase family metal-dependent hydrolase
MIILRRRHALKSLFLLLCIATCSGADFTILSFNVYFNNDLERYDRLVTWAIEQKADLILFQECTPKFRNVVKKHAAAGYAVTDTNITDGYGQMTLSKLKTDGTKIIELPTKMGRKALVTTVQVAENSFVNIVNVHLESLANAATRREQLAVIKDSLKGEKYIIAGDFNFAQGDAENDALNPLVEMTDADPGVATYDPVNNALAKRTADIGDTAIRIDRCVTNDAEITGTTSVVKNALSDHYAIMIKIKTPN